MTPPRRGIVCAGNWILDLIHTIPAWPNKSDLVEISAQTHGAGGGAANVSLDLASMQVPYPVVPMGCVGDDLHGQSLLQICREAGLQVQHIQVVPGGFTAHTHVMNVPGDSRTFFYFDGVNEIVDGSRIAVEDVAEIAPKIFYLGYLNLLPQLDMVGEDGQSGAAGVLARALAAGMMTCVDLVSTQRDGFARTVQATLPQIDWLLLNEVEAARATGLPHLDEHDRPGMVRAADQLLAGGLRQGCIIHTPRLSLWKTLTQEIWCAFPPLPSEQIKSAVGAGDAFAAGVLHGLHEDWTPEASIELGHKAACACLQLSTASGGLPPLRNI